MIPIILLSCCCFQPSETIITDPVPTQSVQDSSSIEVDPIEFARRLRDRYRCCDIHETYEIEVAQAGADSVRAVVAVRSESDTHGRRILVEFGPFSLLAESSRIALTHRFNRKAVLVAEGRPAIQMLGEVMPPIPIPQLPLLLQSSREDSAFFDEFNGLGPWFEGLTVLRVRSASETIVAECQIRDGNRISIEVDSQYRIRRIQCDISIAEQSGKFILRSAASEAAAIPTWDGFVGEREVVATVGDLKALPGEIKVGDRLPELGVLTEHLQHWSFDETVAGALALAPASRQFVVMVLYDCSSDASRADAVVAYDAVREASRRARRAAALGTGPMVRMTPVLAGTVAIRSLSTDELRVEQERWPAVSDSELLEVTPAFVWVPAGADPISRFAPDARCVTVLVDGQRRIVAVLPFDAQSQDVEAFTIDVLDVVK